MRHIKTYRGVLILLFLLFFKSTIGQTTGSKNVSITLPLVALLDVEPAGVITMNFTAPTEAGKALTAPANNTSKWINYTSAIASGGAARTVSASLNQTIPGIAITLTAAAASGSGGGVLGTPTAAKTLSTAAKNIITGIKGAYTGNGVGNGHQLTIKASISNYKLLKAQTNTQIQIIYTISGN